MYIIRPVIVNFVSVEHLTWQSKRAGYRVFRRRNRWLRWWPWNLESDTFLGEVETKQQARALGRAAA